MERPSGVPTVPHEAYTYCAAPVQRQRVSRPALGFDTVSRDLTGDGRDIVYDNLEASAEGVVALERDIFRKGDPVLEGIVRIVQRIVVEMIRTRSGFFPDTEAKVLRGWSTGSTIHDFCSVRMPLGITEIDILVARF